MRKANWKQIALAALLAMLFCGVTGCFARPDTVDDPPTNPIEVLPFATNTPSPSPDPYQQQGGEQGGWDEWAGTTPSTIVVTSPPTEMPTIAIITASPTPFPAWTYSPPTATPKPTDDGTLRKGSTGTAVRQLQQRLKDLGYYTGSVDGDFGAGTESALRAFQKQNGLTADGVVGQRTLTTLNSSNAKAKPKAASAPTRAAYATSRPTPKTYTPSTNSKYKTLQKGSAHTSDVKRLQQRLKDLGYYNGSVSGVYDDATEAAVVAFQRRNGEWVDGVAGEDTQRRLYSDSALPHAFNTNDQSNTYRTLRSGMSGDDVARLQARLREMYYFNDAANGIYGATTELAVKVFQQRNGLAADGVAGSGTITRMFSSTALYAPTAQPPTTPYKAAGILQMGSMGEEVYKLQERLFDLGYYAGKIDGIYNDTVTSAVRSFQTANKLTADGKAGIKTQQAIYSAGAVSVKRADNTMVSLREGDQGERVLALQALLSTYGYFSGTVDGKYGPSTTMAVQQFQAVNSLVADGIAGPATNQLLYQGTPKYAPTPPKAQQPATNFVSLKQGMSGPDVMVMQEYLRDYGYYSDAADGRFGATTLVALQAFQQRNGLKPDGVAGQETLAVLYGENALRPDGVSLASKGAPEIIMVNDVKERTMMKEKDEGQDVFDLQTRLKELGYYDGEPDGKYGSSTTAAVRGFQRQNSLKVDGTAGSQTLLALYRADVKPLVAITEENLPILSNSGRELEEQAATGAIQASLAGGGVAASYNGGVYYAGGSNGALFMSKGGNERKLYDSPAGFIHATAKGVTFVSGSKILRVPLGGGSAQTLMETGGVKKLSLMGDTMYYLEGNSLVKASGSTDAQVLATGVTDFSLDVYQYTAYIASESGVKSLALRTDGEEWLLVSTRADQVQIVDSVVFFRSGGKIYRIQNGVSVLLLDADATWMGVYRDMVYYIAGDRLYRCETTGQNSQVFYDGQTANVSFVAGQVYITKDARGPVTRVFSVSE
ncbi:MAG: peptidoglycan-binding protein [Firmicutes bacterium]|nr:peptidoglycan-binding protein [Bacillota bacterium]